jgi:hypothetical protein
VDPNLSRQTLQDLINALTHGEKMITFANILDLLGYSKDYQSSSFIKELPKTEGLLPGEDGAPRHPLLSPPGRRKTLSNTTEWTAATNVGPLLLEATQEDDKEEEEQAPPMIERQNASKKLSPIRPSTELDHKNQSPLSLAPLSPSFARASSMPTALPPNSIESTTSSGSGRSPHLRRFYSDNSPKRAISMEESQTLPPVSYVQQYNRLAQELRAALLKQASDQGMNCLEVVKYIFKKIDGNDSGAVTSQEMLNFLQLPELNLFNGEQDSNLESFSQLLLEQIDENGYDKNNNRTFNFC